MFLEASLHAFKKLDIDIFAERFEILNVMKFSKEEG